MGRLRMLRAVQREPGRKVAELAVEAKLHSNTAREHLWVLEKEGLVLSFSLTTGTRGRPPVVFYPVDHAAANPVAERRFAEARANGDALRRVAPDLDRTSELGTVATHQLDTLYEHLEDAGLEPIVDESRLTVNVAPCKYKRVMQEDRSLVCSVHARLVQDHLAQVPGPLRLSSLRPFVTPTRCEIALGFTPTIDVAPSGD